MTFTQRPTFDSLPAEVRTALADELGAAVTSSTDCVGGMSPAAAAVLRLSDGRQVFAKVVSAEVSQPSTMLYDRELGVLPLLGEHVPHARFLAELRLGPWRGVITEALPGGPPGPPWTVESVDATLAALDAFGTAPAGLPEPLDHSPHWNGWRELVTRDRTTLDDWEIGRVEVLAALESDWETWTKGDALVHQDVRGDNAVAGSDGVQLVDWAFGTSGAVWMNRAELAVDVTATAPWTWLCAVWMGVHPRQAGWTSYWRSSDGPQKARRPSAGVLLRRRKTPRGKAVWRLPSGRMAHAVGVRTPYEAMPAAVRAWVDRALGSSVVSATTQQGGFSPGVAARLVTASGRRAFVKAVGPELNPDTPRLFRNEIAVMQGLAAQSLPHAPTLYDVYDDGGGWVGLLLEDIAGYLPPHPWQPSDASRVLDALAELTDALQPSPWPEAPDAAVRSEAFLSRWDNVIADGLALPAWVAGREQELADLARTGLAALAKGDGLSHWDLRADNILLTEDRVVFVDWAHAARAASWADKVILYGDMYGSGLKLPRLPEDEGITGFVAGISGGLWWGSSQPAPPGLPTLRGWQRDSALINLGWLRERLGW